MSATKTKKRPGRADKGGGPTKTDTRRLRAEARADEDLLEEVYELGVEHGRKAKTPGKKRPATRKRTSSSKRRRRRGRRKNRSLKAGARMVASPAAAEISSGIQAVGATFALLLLYLALTNSSAVSGVLGGIRRGLDWLASPASSIPYRN